MKEEPNSQNIDELACPAEFNMDATISIEILGNFQELRQDLLTSAI